MTRSAENDVVNGDEEQFDNVADASHDSESDGAGGGDLFEL